MAGSKLNPKEQEKAHILTSAIEGKITNAHAAKQLRLSIRQVQRVKAAIRKGGDEKVIHKLKGKPSNHAFAEDEKRRAIEIITNNYADFKPGFATEKLQEIHAMPMTSQTIRVWMTEASIWKTRKQKKTGTYRSWRPRKECFGEMEQFDGSYHLWFENRFVDTFGTPIETCLLAGIDDATGKITKAVFAANEGSLQYLPFGKNILRKQVSHLLFTLINFQPTKSIIKQQLITKSL